MSAAALSTRGRSLLILGGVLLYLLFLVVQMPAVWLAAHLPAESPIQLRQVDGKLWQGSAGGVTWRAAVDSLELGRLRWTLQAGELLKGSLGIGFELGQAPTRLQGTLLLGRDGLSLKSVQGHLDAGVIGFASRPLALLQPRGRLALDITELFLSEKRIHGTAKADWQGARSALIAAPLGDYSAVLQAEPDGRHARVTIQTLQGALAMSGDGDYFPGKGIKGRLVLLPPQDERRNLYTPLLNMFGIPDASGAWVLNLDSR
ncbi:MAG: type II secretion system protein N [Pseudomonadota bacterium]|nr:type II secretion system protein N [Pseudomonadota bacterium]MDP2353044.1 type II secretion system protein N [Pseudomonadota bacterium]